MNWYREWNDQEGKNIEALETTLMKVLHQLEIISSENKDMIVCGDLNLDANRFEDNTYRHKKIAHIFLNNIARLGFGNNLATRNTFFSSSGLSSSKIDLVFANFELKEVKVIDKLIADHKHVLIKIK